MNRSYRMALSVAALALSSTSVYALGFNPPPPKPTGFTVSLSSATFPQSALGHWNAEPNATTMKFGMDGVASVTVDAIANSAVLMTSIDFRRPHTFTLTASNNSGSSEAALYFYRP